MHVVLVSYIQHTLPSCVLFLGGTFASVGDRECTHLIVDEAVKELPTDIAKLPKHVVKGEVSINIHRI